MSALSSERMMKLMAYADGELEGAERAEVEKILATDIDAVRFVNEMAGLGELVQMGRTSAPISKAVSSFDIADAVMAKVEQDQRENSGKKVVSISDARKRPDRKPSRNLKVGAGVAAALALAASVFLMTRPKEQPMATTPKAPIPVAQQTSEPMPSHGEGIEVDAVESPGVSVFYLPGQNASTSVVVWVEESANGSGEKKK